MCGKPEGDESMTNERCPYCTYEDEAEDGNPEPKCPFHERMWGDMERRPANFGVLKVVGTRRNSGTVHRIPYYRWWKYVRDLR